MSEYVVLRAAADEDLIPLSSLLNRYGVFHRIYESSGEQVLSVADEKAIEIVHSVREALKNSEVRTDLSAGHSVTQRREAPLIDTILRLFLRAPIVLFLIIVSVLVFLAQQSGLVDLYSSFTILPFELTALGLHIMPMDNQYWRIITPIFIHGGLLHIAFNCLWIWEFGSKIESTIGHGKTLTLAFSIAAVSNVSQYLYQGQPSFGGLSGVVYGFLGFAWVAGTVNPAWKKIKPVQGIALFMLGWLVLCMTGVVTILGFGSIANTAHVSGLIMGGLMGVGMGFFGGRSDST